MKTNNNAAVWICLCYFMRNYSEWNIGIPIILVLHIHERYLAWVSANTRKYAPHTSIKSDLSPSGVGDRDALSLARHTVSMGVTDTAQDAAD